jgi:hypothetical protein
MKRTTIFISHATPEDNDFAIWLASRLQLLGFKVWIDKNSLLGGEKFWEEIDNTIRNESIKFLLVYSKNIFQNNEFGEIITGKLKDGIYKEYSFAETIGKQQKDLVDFIILMNIDGSDYNMFIGADRTIQIPFYENWALGFEQLTKKLEKDSVHQSEQQRNAPFGNWYENEFKIKNGIIKKKELYYSNWWQINQLPDFFYIYQFQTDKQAKLIYERNNIFPISKISNCLSSFYNEIDLHVEDEEGIVELKLTGKFKISIKDVLLGFEKEKFPTQKDAENHLKQLLKRIFHLLMKNRKMYWHEMSNKKLAYYHTPASLDNLKVKFKYPYKSEKVKPKTRNLLGTYQHSSYWHYAVSAKPILTPLVGYSLKNHLTFSDDGFNSWEDKDKIHSHRRSKSKVSRYFNEDWRDFQCAFLNSLSNSEGKIEIPLNKSFILSMGSWPEMFWADFGFFEPWDKERQSLMNDYYEELESEESDENEMIEEIDENSIE